MIDWILVGKCVIAILVYLAIALPLAMALGRRLHEIGKYYPEVKDD